MNFIAQAVVTAIVLGVVAIAMQSSDIEYAPMATALLAFVLIPLAVVTLISAFISAISAVASVARVFHGITAIALIGCIAILLYFGVLYVQMITSGDTFVEGLSGLTALIGTAALSYKVWTSAKLIFANQQTDAQIQSPAA